MSLKLAGLAAVAAVWLVAPGAAGAATTIPAGSDAFATEPNNSTVTFSDAVGTTLPAGFFGLGCQSFQGESHLGGDDTLDVGTDTTVQRLGDLPDTPGASVPRMSRSPWNFDGDPDLTITP